jgi:hypothetical protein
MGPWDNSRGKGNSRDQAWKGLADTVLALNMLGIAYALYPGDDPGSVAARGQAIEVARTFWAYFASGHVTAWDSYTWGQKNSLGPPISDDEHFQIASFCRDHLAEFLTRADLALDPPAWATGRGVLNTSTGRGATAPSAPPAAASATAGSTTDSEVTGRNVTEVVAGEAAEQPVAVFRNGGQRVWYELDAAGSHRRFQFVEENRDDWSVYLLDEPRNVRLQLDLHRRIVRYRPGSQAWVDLYPICGSRRPG